MAWLHAYSPGFERFYTIIIAAICWAVWNVRNKITFDKHILRSPSEISYFAVALIVYWTGLQKPEDKSYLSEGAKKMAQAAAAVYSRRATTSPNQTQMLLIKGA
jgi:glucose dehydrogenase